MGDVEIGSREGEFSELEPLAMDIWLKNWRVGTANCIQCAQSVPRNSYQTRDVLLYNMNIIRFHESNQICAADNDLIPAFALTDNNNGIRRRNLAHYLKRFTGAASHIEAFQRSGCRLERLR